MQKHEIAHEMHVFPNGPHGLGLAKNDHHVSQWTVSLINWFTYNGWL